MSDDDPCTCVVNDKGFIIRYAADCPWPGHPQLQHANTEKLRQLVDQARTGSRTSWLVIKAIKKQAGEGSLQAQALLDELRKYVQATTGG